MYNLFLISDRLSDVILARPVVTVFKSRVNNAVLKLYQPFLLAKSSFSASSKEAMNFSVREALGFMCSISKDDSFLCYRGSSTPGEGVPVDMP